MKKVKILILLISALALSVLIYMAAVQAMPLKEEL
jgi:hypothetical protein